MRRNKLNLSNVLLALLVTAIGAPYSYADVTSPMVKDRGRKYTEEKPMTSYYGSNAAGRMTEASELRFQAEHFLTAGEFDKAVPVAKKAVQFDAGDPGGHLILARALTQKFYHSKGAVDEKLLAECLREWQLIRYHDADPTEQWEAGMAAKRLMRIAKALEKEKKLKQKNDELKLQQELLAAEKAPAKATASEEVKGRKIAEKVEIETDKDSEKESAAPGEGAQKYELSPELKQLTKPKKRLGIF